MKKILTVARIGAFALGAVALTSCAQEAATIEGDTITINELSKSVTMTNFALTSQGDTHDEWEAVVKCVPEPSSAIVFNQSIGGFALTPIANVQGEGVVIEGANGTGTGFSFRLPKGTTPTSYKIKIGNYVLTYTYDTKEWTYSTDDKSFKPAQAIKM